MCRGGSMQPLRSGRSGCPAGSGKSSLVSIRKSERSGSGSGLLYDFAIHLVFLPISVRVRRTRAVINDPAQILSSCGRDITRILRVPATAVLIRELFRSPVGT